MSASNRFFLVCQRRTENTHGKRFDNIFVFRGANALDASPFCEHKTIRIANHWIAGKLFVDQIARLNWAEYSTKNVKDVAFLVVWMDRVQNNGKQMTNSCRFLNIFLNGIACAGHSRLEMVQSMNIKIGLFRFFVSFSSFIAKRVERNGFNDSVNQWTVWYAIYIYIFFIIYCLVISTIETEYIRFCFPFEVHAPPPTTANTPRSEKRLFDAFFFQLRKWKEIFLFKSPTKAL